MELKYLDSWIALFGLILIALQLQRFLRLQKKAYKRLRPPGPISFPFLGNLPNLFFHRKYPDFPNVLADMAEKWGSVMSLNISGNDTVIFSEHETAFAILNNENAQNKAVATIMMERMAYKNIGINFANGPNWQKNRTFTVSALKSQGLNNFSEEILEELHILTDQWDLNSVNEKSDILLNPELFGGAVFNIIWKLVSGGERFEYDDERLKLVLYSTEQFTRSPNLVVDHLDSLPILRHFLPQKIGRTKWLKNVKQFCYEELAERKEKVRNDDEVSSFLDVFAMKILENVDSSNPLFTDEQFVTTLMDLFQNAVDTVTTALMYIFIYINQYPYAESKVLKEIKQFLAADSAHTVSKASQITLPFSFAFVVETLRFSSSSPIVAPRVATGGIDAGGFRIEKGTSLLVNLVALNNSKKVWGDPEIFRPERFLLSCGKVDSSKTRLVMSFGSGRRVCPSQKFSERMLLIFLVEIIRKYEFTRCRDNLYVSGKTFALSYSPKPLKILIRQRTTTD